MKLLLYREANETFEAFAAVPITGLVHLKIAAQANKECTESVYGH
jgi:hypothetical protein